MAENIAAIVPLQAMYAENTGAVFAPLAVRRYRRLGR